MDKQSQFDFDEWVRLAKDEPEKFERLRQEKIEQALNQTPEYLKQRMQGIQWQIDQIRKTAKSPMASCIKISAMMWDAVLGENGLVETIEQLNSPENYLKTKKTNPAKVLRFKKSGAGSEK